jgi:hypothetical protein
VAELSQTRTEAAEPPVARSFGRANSRMLDLLFKAQRAPLEEIIFVADEWLDRARTETHLIAEFISKLATAHSVNNIKMMYRECGQHQIDFIRRDCERFFKHCRRMIESVETDQRAFDQAGIV